MNMKLFDPRSRDDRGKVLGRRGCVRRAYMRSRESVQGEALRELLRRVRVICPTKRAWPTHLLTFVLMVVGFVAVMMAGILVKKISGPREWCIFFGTVGLFCVSFWPLLAIEGRSRGRKTIRTLVAEGRCGHCGQVIAGLSQEEDGCIVCLRCSAAWRASSVLVDRAQAETPWSVRMAPRLAARPEGAWSIRGSHCRAGYVDARGIIMPILKPRDGLLSREVVSAMGEERNARIEKALTPNRRSEWGIVVLAALAYGAIAVLAFSGLLVRMTPEGTYGEMSFVLPLLLGLPVVLFPVLLFRAPASISVPRAVQVRLNEGVCPTCAAALRPAEGDAGQSKCECCGAVWKVTPA